MTILAAEVKFYHPDERSDAVTNGGRMTATESITTTNGNVFPDIPQAERLAGSTKYRKLFLKIASIGDEILYNTLLFFNQYTPGDDYITCFKTAAPETDTQNDILSTEAHFGCGKLTTSLVGAETSIVVTVENWATEPIFANGDVIRITDKQSLGGGGNEEFFTINAAVTPSGNDITLPIDAAVANAYSNTDTYISSGLPLGDIGGTFDTFVDTTAGTGTYDDVTNPVIVDSIGGIDENWTLTFTSATAFDVSGATVGAQGSGTIAGGVAPNNTDFTAPFFTLASAGFAGTWATSDTITFTTHAAAYGVWYMRTVPAAAAALAGNNIEQIVNGENV